MAKKHYKKQAVRNTQKKCVLCSKTLSTIDMCYSSDIERCWECDKLPVQQKLF